MTKLQAYFYTDWAAMTATDWFGLLFTVIVFVVMVIAYWWVLNPKNKQRIESHRAMVLEEDEIKQEKARGR